MSITYISAPLRKLVHKRAGGRCEYCLISEEVVLVAHEIDHIIAEKHGGLTEAENLALSCTICNKHKGSDLTSIDPKTGQITPLYNPRLDQWATHFQIREGSFVPLTPVARVTIRLLQLNHAGRIEERKLLIEAGLFAIPG